jgi:uncharacterized membrane protein (UPF0127 family)
MNARTPSGAAIRGLATTAAICGLLVGGPAVSQGTPALATVQLNAGIHLITAEVAANEPSRERGLMFRQALPPNHGMLFLFDAKAVHCMWMRNTFVPLSVAFLDDDGRIVNIEDMQPQTEDNHCARAPVRYALEMSHGWFAQRGFKAGSVIGGIAKDRPARK